MSIEFLVTSLIVVVAPGTGVLYTLAAGLSARQVVVSGVLINILNPTRVLTWMRRAFGGAFVARGARLALTDR